MSDNQVVRSTLPRARHRQPRGGRGAGHAGPSRGQPSAPPTPLTADTQIQNEDKPCRPLTRVAGCSWNGRPDARGMDGRMSCNAQAAPGRRSQPSKIAPGLPPLNRKRGVERPKTAENGNNEPPEPGFLRRDGARKRGELQVATIGRQALWGSIEPLRFNSSLRRDNMIKPLTGSIGLNSSSNCNAGEI